MEVLPSLVSLITSTWPQKIERCDILVKIVISKEVGVGDEGNGKGSGWDIIGRVTLWRFLIKEISSY